MASSYPSAVAVLTNPQATDKLNSPSHSGVETAQNNEIVQIETVIGTASSAIGTIIGDLRNPASNGGGHVQTANKGGTGITSYAKGDLLVGVSSSVLTKLAIGNEGEVLKVSGGTPAYGTAGGWTLVTSGTFTGNFSISSLNGNTDKVYRLVVRGNHSAAGGVSFTFNADGGSNYYTIGSQAQRNAGSNNSTLVQQNAAVMETTPLGEKWYIIECLINSKTSGKVMNSRHSGYTDTSNYVIADYTNYWNNTTDNLVSIQAIVGGTVTDGDYWLYKIG